jgi:hypothetical protein
VVVREGDIIFLSASVPVREGWVDGSKPTEIEEAIISIARAVFARKGRLMFGGHPSVSPLVSAVASEYFAADPARQVRPVVTFQSRLFEAVLPNETTEMVRLGWSTIEWTPVERRADPAGTREQSLILLRERMLPPDFAAVDDVIRRNELRPPLAMIAVGGMNGVRDEAYMFLQNRGAWGARRHVFAFRSGGGAAARLLEPSAEGLWPGAEADRHMLAALRLAREQGDIVDIEAVWRRQFGGAAETPFEPYAAISQWLLDAPLDEGATDVRAQGTAD